VRVDIRGSEFAGDRLEKALGLDDHAIVGGKRHRLRVGQRTLDVPHRFAPLDAEEWYTRLASRDQRTLVDDVHQTELCPVAPRNLEPSASDRNRVIGMIEGDHDVPIFAHLYSPLRKRHLGPV
jgi:hypothetical protein